MQNVHLVCIAIYTIYIPPVINVKMSRPPPSNSTPPDVAQLCSYVTMKGNTYQFNHKSISQQTIIIHKIHKTVNIYVYVCVCAYITSINGCFSYHLLNRPAVNGQWMAMNKHCYCNVTFGDIVYFQTHPVVFTLPSQIQEINLLKNRVRALYCLVHLWKPSEVKNACTPVHPNIV